MLKMLVTRPEPGVGDTLARLDALGIEGIAAPLMVRATLHSSLPNPAGFAALALTSANALRALEEREALATYRGLTVFAVGERSAAAARAAGFTKVVAAGGTMQHLAEAIAAAGLDGPVFYPTARHQAGDLAKVLAPAGVMVVTTKVYDMHAASALPAEIVAGLGEAAFAAALFYSRRTAEIFVDLAGQHLDRDARAGIGVLCLSAEVARPLVGAQFVRVGLADQPSEEAMMALALAFARDQNTA